MRSGDVRKELQNIVDAEIQRNLKKKNLKKSYHWLRIDDDAIVATSFCVKERKNINSNKRQ